MSLYTVQLLDTVYGRIVLDEVDSDSSANAQSAALADVPVSGPHTEAFSGVGNVVDQVEVLQVSGKDAHGNTITSPTQLPAVP